MNIIELNTGTSGNKSVNLFYFICADTNLADDETNGRLLFDHALGYYHCYYQWQLYLQIILYYDYYLLTTSRLSSRRATKTHVKDG